MEWKPIKTAPTNRKKMFVVRAFNVTHGSAKNYTSDPVCVWAEKGSFVRWWHDFKPTHWCELPEPPA